MKGLNVLFLITLMYLAPLQADADQRPLVLTEVSVKLHNVDADLVRELIHINGDELASMLNSDSEKYKKFNYESYANYYDVKPVDNNTAGAAVPCVNYMTEVGTAKDFIKNNYERIYKCLERYYNLPAFKQSILEKIIAAEAIGVIRISIYHGCWGYSSKDIPICATTYGIFETYRNGGTSLRKVVYDGPCCASLEGYFSYVNQHGKDVLKAINYRLGPSIEASLSKIHRNFTN